MLKLKLRNESEEAASEEPAAAARPVKLSLNLDKPANPVRIRLRPSKVLVEGYDSEAPDREEDPVVEEAVVLRMLPGVPAVEALHRAAATNDFSGVSIRFEDRRHATVAVDGERFAAQLMDLPTVTEVHKTFDRRNIFKTVDVSQILLVTHRVGDAAPDLSGLVRLSGDAQSFPHGLTPPLYNVRNRRFQKRMSNKAIETLEAQVDELLQRDAAAKEVRTELLPASAVAAQQALAEAAKAAAAARVADSDMEVDEDLDEELEKAMMDTAAEGSQSDDDDDDDDEDEDDEDDEERPDGGHYDDDDSRAHSKQLREEIQELEATIDAKERAAGSLINDIMRARHMDAVNRLRAELEKKQGLLTDAEMELADGEDDDEAESGAEADPDVDGDGDGDGDGDEGDAEGDAEGAEGEVGPSREMSEGATASAAASATEAKPDGPEAKGASDDDIDDLF